jgi:hypothetical protein
MAVPHELILIPTRSDEINQLILDLETIDLPTRDKNAADAQEYREIVGELHCSGAEVEKLKGIQESPQDTDLPPPPEIGEIISIYDMVDSFIEQGVRSSPGGGLKIGGEVVPGVKFNEFVQYGVENRDQWARKKLREVYPDRRFPDENEAKSPVCNECGKKFSRMQDLRRHHTNIHRKKNLFQCRLCDKAYSRKDNLMQHERRKH